MDKDDQKMERPDTGLVRQVDLFASLPTSELELLARSMCVCQYPPGGILFREGEIGDRLLIILDGQVEVIKSLGEPGERVLSLLGTGEWVGEMSLLFNGGQRFATVRAAAPVTALGLPRADFTALIEREPRLAVQVLQALISRMGEAESATVAELWKQNDALASALRELEAAQARLIIKERLAYELSMARRIQDSLLPRGLPQPSGWAFTAHWQPAREVGGDFFDFIPFEDGRFGILVGDVSDKGVPAALVMAVTRGILRAAATQNVSPAEVLRRVNDLLVADIPETMFVTCLYALLDPFSGQMVFSSAGHCPPVLKRGAVVEALQARGMPLGMMPGSSYDDHDVLLQPGDSLLLYTDGLVEARDEQGVMVGFPRLHGWVADSPGGAGMIAYLLERLEQRACGGADCDDDIAMVVLERHAIQPGE